MSALDLVMHVIEQSTPYRAPQATRPVDADAPGFVAPTCCFCGVRAATPDTTRSTRPICRTRECIETRRKEATARRRAAADAVSMRGTYRHRP